jgi:hypothetical protein
VPVRAQRPARRETPPQATSAPPRERPPERPDTPREVPGPSLRHEVANIERVSGADSGAPFAARRRLAESLAKSGDNRAATELRKLVVDLERLRGQQDPFACEMLFELGHLLMLAGHPNGEQIALSRVHGLGRASQVGLMRKRLERARQGR